MQYRSWIAGFRSHLGAVVAGLAAGALVSLGVVRHAQYVDRESASIMAVIFPALIGGYVAGRLAQRRSVLRAFLVSVPLALFWGQFMGDVEPIETVFPLILAAGIIGGLAAMPRSPRARWIADRGLLLVTLVYAFWCLPPIGMTAWRYHTFGTTTFPRIVRAMNDKLIALPDQPSVRVTPCYRVFFDDEPGWVSFEGKADDGFTVSGWLNRTGELVIEVDVYYRPDHRVSNLGSASDYLRSLGARDYVIRTLPHLAQDDNTGHSDEDLLLARSGRLDPSIAHRLLGGPARLQVVVLRGGMADLTVYGDDY